MTLNDLFDDISTRIENDPTYYLFAVSMCPKESGEGYEFLWEKPIKELKIDESNKEFCMVINEDSTEAITVDKLLNLKKIVEKSIYKYDICACHRETVDEYDVWVDMPISTFGKSEEKRRYAVVFIESNKKEA